MSKAATDAPLIAIIDDDDMFVGLLVDLFTDEGYRVVTGGMPDAALLLLRAHRPDLAVLDLAFGSTHEAGLALLGALRVEQHFARLPVIVVSGAAEYLRAHAAAFAALNAVTIPKPLDLDALLDAVARMIPGPARG